MMHGVSEESVRVLGPALEAANRIIHGDKTEDDVQLVAGVLIQLVNERVRS